MNLIDYLNIFLKYSFVNLISLYLCTKISNFNISNKMHKFLIIPIFFALSILSTILSTYVNPSYMLMIVYVVLSIFYIYITKYKLDYCMIISFISLAIAYLLYELTILLSILIFRILLHFNNANPIILFFAITLEFLAIYKFFKIKRFKNGLTFFKDKNRPYDLAIFLSGIVILIITSLGNYINQYTSIYSFLSLILILASIFIWIRKRITLHYRNLLTKDTIANLQAKLDEQISINENMKNEIEKLSKINHKFSSRIHALELYVAKLSNKLANDENISDNILESKKLINRLSTEFSNELKIDLENDFLINKTGIINIDNILEYFYLECSNKNISFNVIIKNNIKDSVNNAIPLNLLETLIADMIKNSIIAIGYSSNKNPKILVQFDNTDCFEFRIYDTGIEFELDTLVTLGKEIITTHKDDGGSGIGFVTTFETLEETNGSFIIEEYPPDDDDFEYAKCLIFRFDSKGKYIIRSYRFEEIDKISSKNIILQHLILH